MLPVLGEQHLCAGIGLCLPLLARDLAGWGGISQHPEFEKKIYTIDG